MGPISYVIRHCCAHPLAARIVRMIRSPMVATTFDRTGQSGVSLPVESANVVGERTARAAL